jgi:geranylgeranyl pyrophosphate synthase
MQSSGIARTKALALSHAQKAVAALDVLPDCESKDALIHLCYIVLSRDK